VGISPTLKQQAFVKVETKTETKAFCSAEWQRRLAEKVTAAGNG
jgi:hypothetical protein